MEQSILYKNCGIKKTYDQTRPDKTVMGTDMTEEDRGEYRPVLHLIPPPCRNNNNKTAFLSDVTRRNFVHVRQRFEATCCFHLQYRLLFWSEY